MLLAVIGPNWLSAGAGSPDGRRLDNPRDFVRLEIASALKRGILVAPILLDGVAMPREDQLPADLKPLARRNAVEIRRASFDADTERMIRGLNLNRSGARPAAAVVAWRCRMDAASSPCAAGACAWRGRRRLWSADPLGWKTGLGA